MAAIAVTLGLLPYVLRLAGLFPANGEPATIPLFLFIITLGTNMIASVVVSNSRSGAGVDI